jgi:hypothetical protein
MRRKKGHQREYRGVSGGWAGWAIAHPVFVRIYGTAGQRQQRATLLLAHPVLGSHLCPCYSIKIHTSGNRTIGDRTSGGPPAQCTYSDSNLKVIQ